MKQYHFELVTFIKKKGKVTISANNDEEAYDMICDIMEDNEEIESESFSIEESDYDILGFETSEGEED